jgi:outer membrane translocation and assembly module TamA
MTPKLRAWVRSSRAYHLQFLATRDLSRYLEDCETWAYISCMLGRGFLPVLPLLVMFVPPTLGQLPKRVEKCLPYPTLAQEIRDMQSDPVPPRVKVHVIRLEFDSNDGIPADAREEISTELRSHVFERDANTADLSDLANEIAEVGVRGALQNRGYFAATATAKLTELHSEGAEISVAAAISATPGTQYHIRDIRIESADIGFPLSMSPEVLRELIPLQRGELFNVERIRGGLTNLTRVYAREGYVDMTPGPDFEIDEAHEAIDMVVKIDQQAQYRVGSIEFLGVNTVTQEKLMESLPKPGEIFDRTQLDDFFKVNRAILPLAASKDDVNIKRDLKTRTVAILFDFWTCSPTAL